MTRWTASFAAAKSWQCDATKQTRRAAGWTLVRWTSVQVSVASIKGIASTVHAADGTFIRKGRTVVVAAAMRQNNGILLTCPGCDYELYCQILASKVSNKTVCLAFPEWKSSCGRAWLLVLWNLLGTSKRSGCSPCGAAPPSAAPAALFANGRAAPRADPRTVGIRGRPPLVCRLPAAAARGTVRAAVPPRGSATRP